MSQATDLIRLMPEAFDPAAAGELRMTVQFAVSEPMYVVIDNGRCDAHEGTACEADITLKTSDEDLVDLMTGRLNGVDAFLSGKVQVDGDPMLAQKVTSVFDRDRLA